MLEELETSRMQLGACAVRLISTVTSQRSLLCYPAADNPGAVSVFDLASMKMHDVIEAHQNPIRCLALSATGDLIATASERGTVIRVHKLAQDSPAREFRRGVAPCEITCMCFSEGGSMLCAGGTNGSVHIFSLSSPEEAAAAQDQRRQAEESSSPAVPYESAGFGSFSLYQMVGSAAAMVSAAVQTVPASLSALDLPRHSSIVRIPTDPQIQHVWCRFARSRRDSKTGISAGTAAGESKGASTERLVLVSSDESVGRISLHDVSADATEVQLQREYVILE